MPLRADIPPNCFAVRRRKSTGARFLLAPRAAGWTVKPALHNVAARYGFGSGYLQANGRKPRLSVQIIILHVKQFVSIGVREMSRRDVAPEQKGESTTFPRLFAHDSPFLRNARSSATFVCHPMITAPRQCLRPACSLRPS